MSEYNSLWLNSQPPNNIISHEPNQSLEIELLASTIISRWFRTVKSIMSSTRNWKPTFLGRNHCVCIVKIDKNIEVLARGSQSYRHDHLIAFDSERNLG